MWEGPNGALGSKDFAPKVHERRKVDGRRRHPAHAVKREPGAAVDCSYYLLTAIGYLLRATSRVLPNDVVRGCQRH